VLAQAIVREGAKSVAAGMNPMDLKRGVDLAVEAIVAGPRRRPKKVTTSTKSRRSAPSPPTATTEIGEMIAKAMEKVGNEGVITVEEAKSPRPSSTSSRACSSTAAMSRPYFITNAEKMIAELEDPYILIFEKKLSRSRRCCRCSRPWCSRASRS
jgi:chaperonin GroEL